MIIAMYTYIASMILWMFPPIKQYKGQYFYFFMLLAIIDPLALIIYKAFRFQQGYFYSFCDLLLIMCLLEWETIKRYKLLIITGFLVICGINLTRPIDIRILLLLDCLIISYIIITKVISYFTSYQKFNTFQIMLLLYTLSLVGKYLFSMIMGRGGYVYFYITNVFEFIFAVYFSFVKGYDTKNDLVPVTAGISGFEPNPGSEIS